jgi:beta-lactamase superfamily II metal-dependent hydrolase
MRHSHHFLLHHHHSIMKTKHSRTLLLAAVTLPIAAFGQANGKLQIHFMNVGQGDGALLVSPGGETVLFDDGVRDDCDKPLSYLQQLGVQHIDYHIASHYHDDHIGCAVEVLSQYHLMKQAFDRGGHYPTKTFTNYTNVVGQMRKTVIEGSSLVLDQSSGNPVRIDFVALNGNGVSGAKDENDLSVVCVARFEQFDAVIGGDLSGVSESKYTDVETSVAGKVGQVEVYKVNHHGSRYSSNDDWLDGIKPKIGIISCGEASKHKHPTKKCLDRLHNAGVITFWTTTGGGVAPNPSMDKVGGNIIVEIAPGSTTFTVAYSGDQTNSYQVWNPIVPPPAAPATLTESFAWSRKSDVYHFASCTYVANISPANVQTGAIPPDGKRIHLGCPKQ